MKKTSEGFICFHNACHDVKSKKFLIFTDENFCVFQRAYYLLRGEQEEMKQYESGGSNVMFFFQTCLGAKQMKGDTDHNSVILLTCLVGLFLNFFFFFFFYI